MKITNVHATTYNVPVPVPLLDEPVMRPFVLCAVETDAGVTGYGITGPIQRKAAREHLNAELGPLVRGMNPFETERVWHACYVEHNPRSQTGAWSSAVSALDIALWDVKGKALEMPVWRLLGGAQPQVPAYITFGLPEYTQEQLVEVARDFAAQGEDKLKMVVGVAGGHQGWREDAARVRAVRNAVGQGVQLSMDANYMLQFNNALNLAKAVEDCGVEWFEEPVWGNDAALLRDLRMRTSIPISAGQNEGHRFRARELLTNGAVDILQPNVVYCGGYTEGDEDRRARASVQPSDCERRGLAASQYAPAGRRSQRLADRVPLRYVEVRRDGVRRLRRPGARPDDAAGDAWPRPIAEVGRAPRLGGVRGQGRGEIPAYAGMTRQGRGSAYTGMTRQGRGSRLHGNDETGARFPPTRERDRGRDSRLRGNDGARGGEIPAYAGTTGQGGRLRADWIPACAGMTGTEGKGGACASTEFQPTRERPGPVARIRGRRVRRSERGPPSGRRW